MELGPIIVERGYILAVSAPSGTGKTSLCDRLAEDHAFATRSISVTTRPQREGELSKRDYEFVDEERFKKLESEGHFLETAQVFKNWYGTPRQPVEDALSKGRVIVMDIDTVGALRIKSLKPQDTVLLFIVPPSMAELEKRLRARGKNSADDLSHRLKMAESEIRDASKFDYIIQNCDFARAYRELEGIVVAERQRVSRLKAPWALA